MHFSSRTGAQAIIPSGPRIKFLPPSHNTPQLTVLMDYILTPTQINQLRLTQAQRDHAFHFKPEEFVPYAAAAIAAMHLERSGEAVQAEPLECRLVDEEGRIEPLG